MLNFLTKLDYMKHSTTFLVISLILTIASVGAIFGIGLNRGIDFTGGYLVEVKYEAQVSNGQIQDQLASLVGSNISVQQVALTGNDVSEFIIRVPQLDEAQREQLFTLLGELGEFERISEEEVSGSVSRELAEKAIIAVIIASVLQIIYITLRFEFKFGVTAVVALLHDVIVTLGLVALFQVQINGPFVAAILAVLGYSINDTIVLFDRIRENMAGKKKGESLAEVTTRSIQQTVLRCLYTNVSTLLVLGALLFLGGGAIRDMAMTLFIGIAAASYSSIFVAAALWLKWRQWDAERVRTVGGKPVKAG